MRYKSPATKPPVRAAALSAYSEIAEIFTTPVFFILILSVADPPAPVASDRPTSPLLPSATPSTYAATPEAAASWVSNSTLPILSSAVGLSSFRVSRKNAPVTSSA